MATKRIFLCVLSLTLSACSTVSSKVSTFMAKPDTRYLYVKEQPMLVLPKGLKQDYINEYQIPKLAINENAAVPPSLVPPGSPMQSPAILQQKVKTP